MKTLQTNYTGRKAHTGRICFDEKGRMHIFVTYCTDCNGKVIMSLDEARTFARQHVTARKKTVDRLILAIAKKRHL